MLGEKGNISLYTIFLLPLVLLSTFLSIDISGWNSLRNSLQLEADNLALQAAYALPDKNKVKNLINQAILQNKNLQLNADIYFPTNDNSVLGLTLSAKYLSSFSSFVNNNLNDSFSVSKQSIVQIVPTDYVIILPDGNSLRPKLSDLSNSQFLMEQAWGKEDEWPASNYFNCALKPNINSNLGWQWWRMWDDKNFRRWATQSCFNPVLSPLKFAATKLVDSLSQIRTNRISLIFSPGEISNLGFSVERHLRSGLPENKIIGGFFTEKLDSSQAYWKNYLELERFLGDEMCMIFSNPDSALDSNYELYNKDSATEINNNCPTALKFPPCSTYHQPTEHFNECYLEQSLLLKEAIYWHAAKLKTNSFSAEANIPAALEQALIELSTTNEGSSLEDDKNIRGNIAYSSPRKVLIFTDNLPDIEDSSNNFQNIIKQMENSNINLIFIAFSHQGLKLDEKNILQTNFAKLRNLKGKSKLFSTQDPEELQTKLIPQIINIGRTFAIKK